MVLDRTTDGVVMTDGDGVIVYANVPLLKMFGYDAEDLIGQPVEALLPGYLIYTSHFEPVAGGAAPPNGIAKEQPAAQHYVFTIDKKGRITNSRWMSGSFDGLGSAASGKVLNGIFGGFAESTR